MKRIITLTESDLTRIIKKILNETDPGDGQRDDFSEYEGREDIYVDSEIVTPKKDDDQLVQQVAEYFVRRLNKKKLIKESKDSINVWPLVTTYKYYNDLGSQGTFNKIFKPELEAGKEPFVDFVNGCATKVSLALNAAGHTVKPGFKTTSPTDKNPKGTPIQTSASRLKDQLLNAFGRPDVYHKGTITEEELQKKFGDDKTGVLICAPCGFSGASGHATIWSRNKGKGSKGGPVDDSDYHINNPGAEIYLWRVGTY